MCKRLFFLISFVLVLSFGTNALAEDLSIPYWAGGERTAWAVWYFNDDGLSNWGGFPEGYPNLYDGPDPNFEATYVAMVQQDYTWYDQYQGRQGVWVTTGGNAGDMLGNMVHYEPDLDCTKTKYRFQVTYYPIVGEGLVNPQIGPNGWILTGSAGDWDYWDDHIVDLPGGWKHATMEVTVDPWEYEGVWWELMGGNHAIDEFIIDAVCYSGDEPPAGTGMRPRLAGAFNPRPADGADRVDPDNLLLIWDPDHRSAQETVYFSDNFNDVNDRVQDANRGVQDANYYPADGNSLGDVCDLILGETYYWAIDEVNVPADFDGPGPVWSFTIKTKAAGAPSPDVNEIAGPCPTLTWDPGYDANTHYVYFDVNEARVDARDMDPCATLEEPIAESWTPPGPLEWDTTYFWAVDENDVCDVLHSGPLWSFKTGTDPCIAPIQRNSGNSLYAMWGFDSDWGSGKPIADPNWVIPADPCLWEANCVDLPNDWEASYTPAGGSSRSGIADMKEQPGGFGSLRLKHTDYANIGQTVTILAELVWSGESAPDVTLSRNSGWGDNPAPDGGMSIQDSNKPDPIYSFELCDGWMYSLYQEEFELVQTAENIHVLVQTEGDFYLDYVEVDAWWRTPLEAHDPTPPDGEVDVSLSVGKLTWRPGLYADKHDVYLGTDKAAVTDACSSVLVSDNQDPNYYPPGAGDVAVNPGTTYYWKVDEVNDTCDPCLWPGYVWSFTTIPYVLIDDFETYASSSELYAVWEDWHSLPEQGGETILEGSAALVHGDLQSMKFRYDQGYGEPVIRRTYSTPQDFSAGGFAALWMWVYGDANNAGTLATGMYMELGDDDNSDGTVDDMAKIYYSDPRTYSSSPYHDANDLWRKTYYQWGVALEDFNDDNNVNPDKIKTIAFGVNGGDSGQIYFDDMRLYIPRCLSDYALQFGNLVDPEDELDCFVDEADLDAMSDDWLLSDLLITSTLVDDSNLVVKYVFDDVNGLNDVSGNNYHGVAVNDVSVHDGVMTLVNDDSADFNTVEIGGIDANMFNGPFTIVMDWCLSAYSK
jgi:hypothetical protein